MSPSFQEMKYHISLAPTIMSRSNSDNSLWIARSLAAVHTDSRDINAQLISFWIYPWCQSTVVTTNITFTFCRFITFGTSVNSIIPQKAISIGSFNAILSFFSFISIFNRREHFYFIISLWNNIWRYCQIHLFFFSFLFF